MRWDLNCRWTSRVCTRLHCFALDSTALHWALLSLWLQSARDCLENVMNIFMEMRIGNCEELGDAYLIFGRVQVR